MSPAEWDAVGLSVRVSLFAVALSLPAGVIAGWTLARFDFFGKALLETAINLPLVLPPVVTGYLLLVAFGRNGWLGGFLETWFGLRFVFDWKGAALAAGLVSFPLMVRSIRVAFAAADVRLEQAARTLGAGPLDVFWSISIPLARHGIVAGCLLAFARCLGEFGATIMIAGNLAGQTQTIPLYIYNQLESPDGFGQSTPLVLVSIVIAAFALLCGDWMERKGCRFRNQ